MENDVKKELYWEELEVLRRFRKKISSGATSQTDLEHFSDHYEELLAQAKVITRVADRTQKKLDHANIKLREQDKLIASNEQKKLEHEEAHLKRYEKKINLFELLFWFLLALTLTSVRIPFQGPANQSIVDWFFLLLSSFSILILPVLSLSIFGLLPLQFLKNAKLNFDKEEESISEHIEVVKIGKLKSEDFFAKLCTESSILSDKIFKRSSFYLLIGSLIALIGVVYFSFQTIGQFDRAIDLQELLIQFIPRLGSLFFIEFVAFFFLKQYRLTIDEYRHYESIKRQREANLWLQKLYSEEESTSEATIDKIANSVSLFDDSLKLKSGETTELVQSRKFASKELTMFERFIDVLNSKYSKPN